MPTQKQRSDATRELLLDAFRRSLLRDGLEATTTASVLAQTGLSKGALYHHFSSKTEIVEAIYRAESHGAIGRVLKDVDQGLPALERLKSACRMWLAEVRDPSIAAILFRIGPEAIGVDRAKQIENEVSLELFEELLNEARANGEWDGANPQFAARLVNALVAELALAPWQEGPEHRGALIGPLIDGTLDALSGANS